MADEKLTAFLELEAAVHREREIGMKQWEIIADNLSKARLELGLYLKHGSRGPTILGRDRRAQRRWTLLSCAQIKSCLPFSNSNPQLKPTGIMMSAIARNRMKNWELIADSLSKAGWSWGCVSAVDAQGRTIWIAHAHRRDGKRYVVRADERLTAFVELERTIYGFAVDLIS